jgi:hypothetical protein
VREESRHIAGGEQVVELANDGDAGGHGLRLWELVVGAVGERSNFRTQPAFCQCRVISATPIMR